MIKRQQPKIALVSGGPSEEAAVSRHSAAAVAAALEQRFANVKVLELDRRLPAALLAGCFDVVFPLAHGTMGEDGCLQGLLEVMRLPYVGSGVLASACAMNKGVAKRLFRSVGLPVARDTLVHRSDDLDAAAEHVCAELGEKVVVKPLGQGSGLGVSLLTRRQELPAALSKAFAFSAAVLVEERIVGREVTAAVLEAEGIAPLPVCEIRTPPGTWYDYEHRYTAGLSEHLLPAPLPKKLSAKVQQIARQAHEILGCRDLSRADLMLDADENPVLLEVNTLPGMTLTSLFPDAVAAIGWSLTRLVEHLVDRALARA